uniref:Aminotransferase class I/classII large domain-containing protein n=1 Tax=Euplotes harpa TaxID=151035 RepID=A0A7S3JNZ0_9SPIT|mmetsp:Transcript_7592/g.8570  ORF Transcript_7592/g.8570 Transcript_7592/m.8570 type:complete len:490 (+) Transcript_7592:2-1471(+)
MNMKRAFSVMNKKTIAKCVQEAEYAVRGAVAIRAAAIKKEMAGGKKFKFNKLVPMHSGNPHALNQPPLTFGREVLSLALHDQAGIKVDLSRYSKDAIDRTKRYLDGIEARAIGAYAGHTSGYDPIKQDVADFIKRRDGHDIDLNNLYLSTGASECIELFIRLLIAEPNDGIMIPIPNYPLYSAAIIMNGGQQVPYYLDESQNWGLNIKNLEKSYQEHKDKGVNIKGIAVLNPGNPTGQVLTKQNLKDVLEFAHDKKMVVLADEVYQENIYTSKKFYSMRSVMHELGDPIKSNLELVSMHSVSKGFTGECGLRGGYFEFENLDPFAREMIYKLKSMKFCAPTPGMIAVGTMVNPPREGVNSKEVVDVYNKEKNIILDGLNRRAKLLYELLNKMEGVKTNPTEGALYSFAKLDLPKKFVDEAISLGRHPDMHFCLHLVEETGMITVPGSGFGQDEGTNHLRMTNLIFDDDLMDESMDRMHIMVKELHEKYR